MHFVYKYAIILTQKGSVNIIQGYKIRIYPTKNQEEFFIKSRDASRFIWNYMLNKQEEKIKLGQSRDSYTAMSQQLSEIKQHYPWLKEVDSHTLQITCRDLNKAYVNQFNGLCNKPNYKKLKNQHFEFSFPIRGDGGFYFKDKKFIKIPKLNTLVKYKTDLQIPIGYQAVKSFIDCRISYKTGKWFVSFCLDNLQLKELTLTDKVMGIDLGVKDFAIVAYGDEKLVFSNINKQEKIVSLKKEIEKNNKAISIILERNGCNENTNKIKKLKEKNVRYKNKIINIRKNYLHQVSNYLTKELKPKKIVMENLIVKDMLKNKNLKESILEENFYTFREIMGYKCKKYNIDLILANTYFPSSKMCSNCGYVKDNLSLSDRIFKCPKCGLEIDRDYNAAINLQNYNEKL